MVSIAYHRSTKDPCEIVSGETTTMRQPAESVPSKASSRESIPVVLVIVRQFGNVGLFWGVWVSASGLSCSGLKSQKRRLVGVGLRQTQGGHHLNSAVQKVPRNGDRDPGAFFAS